MGRDEAIAEAGSTRMRPILMTTLTTIISMVPMALGIGEGLELMAPMAVSVMGGLIASTLLTLFIIPVLYAIVDDIETKRGSSVWQRRRSDFTERLCGWRSEMPGKKRKRGKYRYGIIQIAVSKEGERLDSFGESGAVSLSSEPADIFSRRMGGQRVPIRIPEEKSAKTQWRFCPKRV